MEELEERHQVEIKVYKQKVERVIAENRRAILCDARLVAL